MEGDSDLPHIAGHASFDATKNNAIFWGLQVHISQFFISKKDGRVVGEGLYPSISTLSWQHCTPGKRTND